MGDRRRLPPFPTSLTRPERQARRAEGMRQLVSRLQSGELRPRSEDEMEDQLLAVQSAFTRGDIPGVQESLGKMQATQQAGLGKRLLKALESAALPFEAFAEGINALIGPAVPQEAFQKRSARSRTILKAMFTGDVSPAEAAGLLRDVTRERSTIEQLLTGFFFDPLNVIIPGAAAVKAGIKGGVTAGLRAGARTGMEWTAPWVGGKVAAKLGLKETAALIKERAAMAADPERYQRVSPYEFKGVGTPEESDEVFQQGLVRKAQKQGLTEGDLKKMLMASEKRPGDKVVMLLAYETGARDAEIATIRVRDIRPETSKVAFHDLSGNLSRVSEELSTELMEVLGRASAGKNLDDFIFPEFAKLKNPGAGVNRVLTQLGQAAELGGLPKTLITATNVRSAVATQLAHTLIRQHAPLSLVDRFLGHRGNLTVALRHYVKGDLAPDADVYLKFMDEVKGEDVFAPLKPSSAWESAIADAQSRLMKAKAEAPSGAGFLTPRKSKQANVRTAEQYLKTTEGRGKIESLTVDPVYVERMQTAGFTEAEQALVTKGLQAVEAETTLDELGLLHDVLANRIEKLGKGTPLQRVWRKQAGLVEKEIEKISLGIEDMFAGTQGLTRQTPRLNKLIERIVPAGPEVTGLQRSVTRALSAAKSRLTEERVRVIIPRYSRKKLADMGLSPSQLQEKPALTALEGATDDVAVRQAASDWFNYTAPNGLKPIQRILEEKGIEFYNLEGSPVMISSLSSLRRRLTTMGEKGSTLQDIFGNDFRALPIEARQRRVEALILALRAQNLVLDPMRVSAKVKGLGETVRAKAYNPPATTEAPTFVPEAAVPSMADTDAFLNAIHPDYPGVEWAMLNLERPNERMVRFVDKMRRAKAEGWSWAAIKVGYGWAARNLIEIVGLRGVAAKGVTRPFIGRDFLLHTRDEASAYTTDFLRGKPGHKKLWELAYDPKDPNNEFFKVKIREEAFETDLGKTLAHDFAGDFREAQLGKRGVVEWALHSQMALFDGKRGVPRSLLTTIYEFDREVYDYILAVRRWPQLVAERMKAKGVDLEKLLGQELYEEWFPSIEKSQKIPSVAGQALLKPGIWMHRRAVQSLSAALKTPQVQYHNYLDAAAHAVGDMERYAADLETISLLKKGGLTESFNQYKIRDKQARLLGRIHTNMIETGQPGPEFAEIEKLLALRQSKDIQFSHLGELANDVLKGRESALAVSETVALAVKQADEALKDAKRVRDITGSLEIPGLKGLKFTEEIEASKAADYWKEADKNWTELLGKTNAASVVLRFMVAGLDLSVLFIHGLLTFAARPLDWTRGAVAMGHSLYDPNVLRKYLSSNVQMVHEFRQHGGMLGLMEPLEGAPWVIQQFGKVPFIGRGMQGVSRRFETAFTTWQDVARLEMWKAMRSVADGEAAKLGEVASFVNKMTGVYNPSLAGLPTLQRYLESSFLSFAPMYRRAAYGLLTSVFTGGKVTRELAAKNLIHAAFAGFVGMGVIPYMMGNNKESLNRLSPKFLSWRVGDKYIGIGSAYYSLIRAIAAVYDQASDPEERGKLGKIDVRDNALLKWWRSQAPPIPSAAIDLVLGTSYIGEPLRGEDGDFTAVALAKWGQEQITPMMIETLMREFRGPGDAALMSEGLGTRSFPESKYDRRRVLRNNLLQAEDDTEIAAWRAQQERKGEAIVYSAMPALLRRKLDKLNPELQALETEIREETLKRGRKLQKKYAEYLQETQQNRDIVDKGMTGVANSFGKGEIDSTRFRTLINQWQVVLTQMQIKVADSKEYAEVIADLDEAAKRRELDESTFFGDLMYDKYVRVVMQNELNINEDGIFQYDQYEKADTFFRMAVGQQMYDYVQRRRVQNRQIPSLVNEYLEARVDLKPYWKLHETIWKPGTDDYVLIDNYLSLAANKQTRFKQANPRVRMLERRIDLERQKFRRANPELDWLLVKWYSYVPVTTQAQEKQRQWEEFQLRNQALT